MAKMFYTLSEAAEALGVGEEEVKQMASAGKLQQFRDRDKLMFKRDQVDNVAMSAKEDTDIGEIELEDAGISTGSIALDDGGGMSTGEIPTATDADKVSLSDDLPGSKNKSEDSRMATGISVFDAGEIDEADPMTQTVVTPMDDEEELALESVGSGSGLLDLTQESDDTSLGAELLDEIYPGGEGSDLKLESPASSSGVFEPGAAAYEGSSASGLEYHTAAAGETVYVEAVDEPDPAGNGLGIGMMWVGFGVLITGMYVALSAVMGKPILLTRGMAGEGGPDDKTLMYVAAGWLGGAIIFGLVGFLIGKSMKGRRA